MNLPDSLQTKPERNVGIDLLRIISMIMVLTLHVLGQGGILDSLDKTASPISYNVAWLMETASFCAVNCYALISGYVGIKSKYRYSNIAVLWLQVAFYTVGFTVLYSFLSPEAVTSNSYYVAILPVTKRAYWYFTAYFAIFFLIPMFNHTVRTMGKRQLGITVISIIAIYSFIYTLSRSTLIGSSITDLLVMERGYSPIWLALLYIIGAYISKYRDDFKIPPWAALTLYSVAILIGWFEKITVKKSVLVSYTSPTTLIAAIALLLAFSALPCKRIGRIVAFLSPAAFGVFLVHSNPLVWTSFMKGHFASFADKPAWLMVLLVLGAVLALYIMCSAIDLLRHYLFKLLRIKPALAAIESKLVGNLWDPDAQTKTD